MSAEDIWYFLRGQEQVGPFSKPIIQQIYQGGQLTPETLVWREGMDGWKPARDVAELELSSAPAAPAAEEAPKEPEKPATPPDRHGAVAPGQQGKLKLRSADAGPMPSAPPPQASPIQVPPPNLKHSPLKVADAPKEAPKPAKPGSSGPVSPLPPSSPSPGLVADDKPAEDPEEKRLKEKKKKIDEGKTAFGRAKAYLTSSLFIAPLFLVICGVLMFLGRSKFPDILWVTWGVIGYGVFGLVSLCGVRSFDGVLRLAAILFLAPAIVLFWPVLMRDLTVQAVPPSYWVFLGFCVLYGLTVRIGLNNYITDTSAKVACFTGILIIAFIAVVGRTDVPEQRIPGWKDFVEKGSRLRLPGSMARLLNQPDWGTEVGHMVLATGEQQSRHGLESAELKKKDEKEYQLVFRTLEGIQFFTKIATPEGGYDVEKVIGLEWPVFFKKADATSEETVYESANWLMKNGQTVEVAAARLKVEGVDKERNVWKGSLSFILAPEKGAKNPEPKIIPGQFETIVTETKP